ncbi:MAG: GTPase domain-containing protein [Candidatus Methanomethylophilaceae archaeon]|nr:GTPase domain-containing protein [Candidatus Methanomethylophilaceae archaeon]
MNGTSKVLVGSVYGAALAYALLSLILSLQTYGGDAGTTIPGLGLIHRPYSAFISSMPYGVAIAAGGFALSVAGMFTKGPLDVAGRENPVEYLWTHRPNAFLRCLAAPWGLITSAWEKDRRLVAIPVALSPLYAVWSLLITVALVVPFAIAWATVSWKISSARENEKVRYRTSTQFAVCPSCKRRFSRPNVICSCGLVIDYPVPGIHGIRQQTCNNGDSIPCTAGSRTGLATSCPYCRKKISTHEAMPVCVSLAGASRAGKTTLMLASAYVLIDGARRCGIPAEAATEGLSPERLAAKDSTDVTLSEEAESECLFLKPHGEGEREIVFNDIAGSEFEPDLGKHLFEEYYKYADGTLFVFDPTDPAGISGLMDVFDSFYGMFTQIRCESPGTKSDVMFAVVASRRDRTGLEDGDVRPFLMSKGQDAFVNTVESLFPNHEYFSVCSVGSDCQSAVEPLMWILHGVDRDLADRINAKIRANK